MRCAGLVLFTITIVLAAGGFAGTSAQRQQARQTSSVAESYPAFTRAGRVLDYDAAGNAVLVFTEIRYFSANGDWHYRADYPGGIVVETIYRSGQGVFFPDHRNQRLIKVGEPASGSPRRATAESLSASPNFARTERVLDRLAYVHRRRTEKSSVEETYYVPEFGLIPVKRVTVFAGGVRRIEEPLSLTPGEPEPGHFKGAEYQLAVGGQMVFDAKLADRMRAGGPERVFPPEAAALGISGTVTVQVIVDAKSGEVLSARVTSVPLPFLDEAAMNAALGSRFEPSGDPEAKRILITGVLKYEFALPKTAGDKPAP
ncbi:MAG: energy transducer TonB [Acidobacteriota bacterium]|nr:energy transducer TonB [Acidobacteriota bacterium]